MDLAKDHGGSTESFPASPHRLGAVADMKRQPLREQHRICPCWRPFSLFLSTSSQAQVCPGVQAEASTAQKVSLQEGALVGSVSKWGKGQAMTGQLWAVLGGKGQQGHLYCHCHTLCTDRKHPAPHASVQQALAWQPVWAEQTGQQHAWISAAKHCLSGTTSSQGGVSHPALQTEWVFLLWDSFSHARGCQSHREPSFRAAQTEDMPKLSACRRGSSRAPHTPREMCAQRRGRHVVFTLKMLAVFTKSDTSAQLQSAKWVQNWPCYFPDLRDTRQKHTDGRPLSIMKHVFIVPRKLHFTT